MRFGNVIAAVVLLAMAASASAQDLAAAARKEKERRAALKGKASVTVTNTDLADMKKKAAFSEAQNEGREQPAEGEPAERVNNPSAVSAEPSEALIVETAFDFENLRAELQDKYNRAKEHLDYVNLKMRALQQQFFSFNTMESKSKVQQDIAQTNMDIQAAAAEEARLKKELEDFASKNPDR